MSKKVSKKLSQKKLTRLLKLLSPSELKAFQQYINASYLNKGHSLQKILKTLIREGIDNPNPITIQDFWYLIIPDKHFNPNYLNSRFSFLTNLLEDFLAHQNWLNSTGQKEINLIRELNDRQWDDIFQSKLNKVRLKITEDSLKKNDEVYDTIWKLTKEELIYKMRQKANPRDVPFEQFMIRMEQAYQLQKWKALCAYRSWQQRNGKPLTANLDFVSKVDPESLPLLNIYQQIYKIQEYPENPAPYKQLTSMLFKHHSEIPDSELQDLFSHVLSYSTRMANQGKKEYRQELAQLYLNMHQKGIFYRYTTIPSSDYLNAVTVMLEVGEIQNAREFLEAYHSHLPSNLQNSMYVYCLSLIQFHQGQFKQTVQSLERGLNQFSDQILKLKAEIWICKALYEMVFGHGKDKLEMLKSRLRNFRLRLKKADTITEYQANSFKTFANALHELIAIKLSPPEKQPDKFSKWLDQISHKKEFNSKQWFCEKGEEL